jgi:hypothetical protein
MIAQHASLCPVCGTYIAKSRSQIARLPAPIAVQPQLWPPNLRDGWAYPGGDSYSPATDSKRREWVHERCYDDGLSVWRESRPRRQLVPVPPPVRPAAPLPEFDALRKRLREYNAADEASRLDRSSSR